MRVTENANYESVRSSIARSKERLEKLQHQNATLRKLNTPSDDPVGAAKVLENRTDKANNDQFLTNAKLASTFLENSDHAIAELADIVVRGKEIALGQSSGASSNEDTRLGVAEEVIQLYQQAVAVANRRIGDRYLFGGYKTNKPPVDMEGNYLGDDGQMMIEVAKDVFVTMNIPGIETFNTVPKAAADYSRAARYPATESEQHEAGQANMPGMPENINVFNELEGLRIGLLTGDLDSIRGTLERFDSLHAKLVSIRSKIGSRLKGLDTTHQALERHNLTNAQLNSAIEDADMAQVVSDLNKEETVYRSSLASAQKLIQPTLMDFLR